MTTPGLTLVIDRPGRLVGSVVVPPGGTVAVIGPNGAGKTTLVQAVAGTLEPPTPEVAVGGADWSRLPPQQRLAGIVFQDHLLFPHLDVRGNVAFGARARGVARHRAHEVADGWLRRLGIAGLAERRPTSLSGGQAQRVALARALAIDPQVLLLDEPFASLDVSVAAELRRLLADHLATFEGITVLVTHDALDVRALADQVLVLEDGAVAQVGTPDEVAAAPATVHAAQLLGLNVATVADLVVPGDHPPGTVAAFAPSAVTLTRDEPVGSARNRWQVVVRTAVERAGIVRVRADGERSLYADVTAAAAADLDLRPGRQVWASVKATEVTTFPSEPEGDR